MNLYSAYYFKNPRSCFANVAAIEADNIREALTIATEAIKASFPDARIHHVVRATKSRFPVKNLQGELVAPSQIT